MRAGRRWWSIYRARVLWYAGLPLPALLLPDYLLVPVLAYFELLIGGTLLAWLGVNPGHFAEIRHAAPRSPAWGRFEWACGSVGVVLILGGYVAARPVLCIIGFVVLATTAETALWVRESDRRFRLREHDAARLRCTSDRRS